MVNNAFKNTPWISYRFHLRQKATPRRNFGISLNCMSHSGPGGSLPESDRTLRRRPDERMQRGRRQRNTPRFAWKSPELEISAARLAALRFFPVPPGRYRDRPIPRPTPSQPTIRPINRCCFLGHCTLSGSWVPWFHPDDGVCSADTLLRIYLTRTRRPR